MRNTLGSQNTTDESKADFPKNSNTFQEITNARGILRHDFAFDARRLLLGFGLILMLLLALIAYSLRNFAQLKEADRLNVHTYIVLLKNHEIAQDVASIELRARTFLLTGDQTAKQLFEKDQADFARHHSEIRLLTRDNPDQQKRLQRLQDLFTQWMRETDSVIKARRARNRDRPSLVAVSRTILLRSQSMVEIRNLIEAVEQAEKVLLTQRNESQEEFLGRTGQTLILGGILSVLLVCGLGFMMLSNASQLHSANLHLQRNSEQIEANNRELEHLNTSLQRSNRDTQRANEELQRSNAELEQFAYVASHDLQEPLRAVSGCVQILQRQYDGKLDERADMLIGHAVEGAQRMQTLIKDLLLYSRVGSKGKPFGATDFNQILNQVKTSLSVTIEESGATITNDTFPIIEADSRQMEQVLQNLVSNALKFRGGSVPQVHIAARRDEAAKTWTFSVSDKGPGIEERYFERIWVMFQRLHTRNEYPGTGIGLAICKKIVERHGGTVGVQSQIGEGTTFWFSIPDVKPNADEDSD